MPLSLAFVCLAAAGVPAAAAVPQQGGPTPHVPQGAEEIWVDLEPNCSTDQLISVQVRAVADPTRSVERSLSATPFGTAAIIDWGSAEAIELGVRFADTTDPTPCADPLHIIFSYADAAGLVIAEQQFSVTDLTGRDGDGLWWLSSSELKPPGNTDAPATTVPAESEPAGNAPAALSATGQSHLGGLPWVLLGCTGAVVLGGVALLHARNARSRASHTAAGSLGGRNDA